MTPEHKKILRALVLEIRAELEGFENNAGQWQPGDLERRLVELGVRRDREPSPRDELPRHADIRARETFIRARETFDAYLDLRLKAALDDKIAEHARRESQGRGRGKRAEPPTELPADERAEFLEGSVEAFIRESAYTWANRLLALRCMEARGLIDEVVLQKDVYGGKSLAHWRFVQRDPAAAEGEDEGLFATLLAAFELHAERLPRVFHPAAPGLALRPTLAALRRCLALLSGTQKPRSADPADDAVFSAPDALGWAYQFWNTDTKERVFAAVRTKSAKIEGADIIPATQLYTEPYMVRFLTQNSLGATWAAMHSDTRLAQRWDYFVRDADRPSMQPRSAATLTMLDPACGSGHFLLAAQADLWDMYEEEGAFAGDPVGRARAILEHNLYGLDIDERAVQIAEAALWMAAAEKLLEHQVDLHERDAGDHLPLSGVQMNLVATNIRLPGEGEQLEAFLKKHPDAAPLRKALSEVFRGLAHVDELGSLVKIEGPVDDLLKQLQKEHERTRAYGGIQTDLLRSTTAQGALPLGVESYEVWKDRTLRRLEAHFAAEAVDADLSRRFYGQAAGKALQAFDLLSRRYDVVLANPPYMGSKNMGEVLRPYVETHYAPGKRDLYAAFMLRCLELCTHGGAVAMVTQHSWMFLRSYADLRSRLVPLPVKPGEEPQLVEKGILHEQHVAFLAHLGRYAFSEIGNAVVAPVLFVLRNAPPNEGARAWSCRLNLPREAQLQADLLRAAAHDSTQPYVFQPRQAQILQIPQRPLAYWLREHFYQILAGPKLGQVAKVAQGMATAEDGRFVRFVWEAPRTTWTYVRPQDGRWAPFDKGGGYVRWFGHQWWLVDWQHDGARINGTPGPRVQNTQYFFQAGWNYSRMAQGAMGARFQDQPGAFSDKGPGIFFKSERTAHYCNCRIFSFFVRTSSPSLAFEVDSVVRAPIPAMTPESAEPRIAAGTLVQGKRALVSRDLTERAFNSHLGSAPTMRSWARDVLLQTFAESAVLHTLEGESERDAFAAYGLDKADTATITAEVGTPAGWFDLVDGHTDTDALTWPPGCTAPVLPAARVQPPPGTTLRAALEAGPGSIGAGEDDDSDDSDEDGDEGLTGKPIPASTFLEALAQRFGVHPISLYSLLRAGIESEGWRCPPEEQRLVRDRLTVMILHLLGHQWPTQVAAREPLPEWADGDGIIPITEGTHEDTLLTRMRARLAAEFPGSTLPEIERDIAELIGQSLKAWIEGGFFRHHCKKEQFRRRPVAWQLQYTAPEVGVVFACFIHFHALNADLLPKLRNHYIGPQRTGAETELRGLDALPKPKLNDNQKDRITTLENQITALRKLDDELGKIIARGFFTRELAGYAIDDAAESYLAQLLAALALRLAATFPAGALEAPAATYLRAVDEAAARARKDMPDTLFGGEGADASPRVVGFEEFRADLRRDLEALARNLPGNFDELLTLERNRAKSIEADAEALVGIAPDAAELAELLDSTRTRPTFPLDQAEMLASGDPKALAAAARVLDTHKAALQAVVFTYLHTRLRTAVAERCTAAYVNIPRRYFSVKKQRAVDVHEAELLAIARAWLTAAWDYVHAIASDFVVHDELSALAPGRAPPRDLPAFIRQEQSYAPDLNDGVRVNIAPLQLARLLAADVLPTKDLDKTLKDRARWRSDERRWCRSRRLPRPGWWPDSL
jgi:hypothetical protein